MSKLVALCMSCSLVALATAAAAQAYTRPTDPSYVAVVGCASQGGTTTAPPYTPITVFGGWGAKTRGQVRDWLNASTNTLSINRGAAIDLTAYFAGLTDEWNPPDWSDIFFYDVGTIEPDHSVTISWATATSRPTPDGSTQGLGAPQPFIATFTCTINAE